MVAPSLGPFYSVTGNNVAGPGSSYDFRMRYRQTRPFTLAQPYNRETAMVTSAVKTGGYAWPTAFNCQLASADLVCQSGTLRRLFKSDINSGTNQAREKLLSKLGDPAELIVSLAERRQTISMMSQRFLDLAEFTRQLKNIYRGDFTRVGLFLGRWFAEGEAKKSAKRALNQWRTQWRKKVKSFSSLWLEFHFGWEPLVKDVQLLIGLLDESFPAVRAVTRSRSIKVSNSYKFEEYPASRFWKRKVSGILQVTCFASLEVTNRNAFLAQKLGLLNVPAAGWALVPFSFVVDWFTYVGSWLGQLTDLVGVRVTDSGYTVYGKLQASGYQQFNSSDTFSADSVGVYCERVCELPSVKLGLRPSKVLSYSRAATSISLLLQQLGKR